MTFGHSGIFFIFLFFYLFFFIVILTHLWDINKNDFYKKRPVEEVFLW